MAPGMVEVTTESHENPADHQYTVPINDVTEEPRPARVRITFTAMLSASTWPPSKTQPTTEHSTPSHQKTISVTGDIQYNLASESASFDHLVCLRHLLQGENRIDNRFELTTFSELS